VRIESVRFDASGNPTIVVTGGVSFFLPLFWVDELANVINRMGPIANGKNDVTGGVHHDVMQDAVRRAFLAGLPRQGLEFSEENELYEFLSALDEERKAKRKALELCARAEQSSMGLSAKLAAKGFSGKAVKAAIASLKEEHIVDDARYARVWARGRAERRAAGPALLAAELRSRGQGEDAVRGALADIDFRRVLARAAAKERTRLEAAWRRKGLELDESFKETLYRILKRQGFDSEMILDELEVLG
jgi:regulatory protein